MLAGRNYDVVALRRKASFDAGIWDFPVLWLSAFTSYSAQFHCQDVAVKAQDSSCPSDETMSRYKWHSALQELTKMLKPRS